MAADPEGEEPTYHNLRYLDDFTYLREPGTQRDFWDGAKYIRLGDDPFGLGSAYLSFGGELRERDESYTHPNFGIHAPARDTYLLQRVLLHADLHANDYLRGFLQLGSMVRMESRGVASSTDFNQLDIMQGFVDLRLPSPLPAPLDDTPTLRGGRQEVLLGYQRLVAVREGANERRSFDGARLFDTWNGATLDVLALRPVQDKTGAFNDAANLRQALWGTYLTVPVGGGLSADLYWLGYENDAATFRGRTGEERRQSFGARLFGAAPGWDYNAEAVVQTGTFRDTPIAAWMLAAIAGYTFAELPWQPRIALQANASSGDDPRHTSIGTYNGLYPRLPYFAETSLLVPSNIHDVRPLIGLRPLPGVTVVAGWDTLWRSSTRDALYGNGLVPYPGTAAATSARVGSEVSLDIRWRADQHLTLGTILAQLLAGPALTEAKGKDVTYVVLFATYRF